MIDANQYIKIVREYFNFLTDEFDFKLSEEKVRGNAFYDVRYKDHMRIVSISYENIEDYLLVIIYMLKQGELPDYDDKTRTLHLNQLNARILSKVGKEEITSNDEYFLIFTAKDEFEKKLLKSARELRLCLKHFEEFKHTID